MPGRVICAITGADKIVEKLEATARAAQDWMPKKAASMLAAYAQRAFRETDLRPSPWEPLKDSTIAARGSRARKAQKDAKAARKAAKDALAAITTAKSAKEADKLERRAARAKARAKAKAAYAKSTMNAVAAGTVSPLIDTGRLWHSITSQGAAVTSDAPYAKYHQLGSADGKHPPPRPFVPVKKDGSLVPKVERYVKAALEAELKRHLP